MSVTAVRTCFGHRADVAHTHLQELGLAVGWVALSGPRPQGVYSSTGQNDSDESGRQGGTQAAGVCEHKILWGLQQGVCSSHAGCWFPEQQKLLGSTTEQSAEVPDGILSDESCRSPQYPQGLLSFSAVKCARVLCLAGLGTMVAPTKWLILVASDLCFQPSLSVLAMLISGQGGNQSGSFVQCRKMLEKLVVHLASLFLVRGVPSWC